MYSIIDGKQYFVQAFKILDTQRPRVDLEENVRPRAPVSQRPNPVDAVLCGPVGCLRHAHCPFVAYLVS